MKNSYFFCLLIFSLCFLGQNSFSAEELKIKSSKIKVDKKTKLLFLYGNVSAIDSKNNKITADSAKYNKSQKIRPGAFRNVKFMSEMIRNFHKKLRKREK